MRQSARSTLAVLPTLTPVVAFLLAFLLTFLLAFLALVGPLLTLVLAPFPPLVAFVAAFGVPCSLLAVLVAVASRRVVPAAR